MKRLYIGIVISFIVITATAQNLWLGAEGQRFYDELLNRKAVKGEIESYEGSPYMDEEFTEATIKSSDNQAYEKVPLRYNIYYDLFEVQIEDAVYNLKRGGIVAEVSLPGHSFIYSRYEYLSTEGEGYLEPVEKGTYTLYKKYQVVFKEAEPAQPYQEKKPAAFEKRDPLFYVAYGDNKPVYIRNKKGMLDIAGANEKALNKFIKDNRIKIRDEADMVRVVKFLNNM